MQYIPINVKYKSGEMTRYCVRCLFDKHQIKLRYVELFFVKYLIKNSITHATYFESLKKKTFLDVLYNVNNNKLLLIHINIYFSCLDNVNAF